MDLEDLLDLLHQTIRLMLEGHTVVLEVTDLF